MELTKPTTVIGTQGNHLVKHQARWLDVDAGMFLTVTQLNTRNPGIYPLYVHERRATNEELDRINALLSLHELGALNEVLVGDEPVTGRLVAHIRVKEPTND